MRTHSKACPHCHTDDLEIVPNDAHDFIVLCNECGYAMAVTRQQLLAS